MSTVPCATSSSESSETASNQRKVWIDGAFVGQDQAMVSVFDHGFLYGDGCFEGIRAYNGRVLKLDAHLDRMFASAEKIRLTPAYSKAEIAAAIRESLEVNGLSDAYIRLVFSRGKGTLGLHPFKCPTPGTIIIADSIELYPPELYENGLDVIVAKRPRIPIPCLDPAIKSLNYLNNILAKIEAIDAGVLEAIMLNVEGNVSECTGDNIFIVTHTDDGASIVTPPTGAGILHGITRQFVINEIAPACGYTIEERTTTLEQLMAADEVFLTGTAAEVIGVRAVDGTPIGDGSVGRVTRELIAEFRQRVAADAPED